MSQNFRVSLTGKLNTLCLELFTNFFVIFNDAVVNQGDLVTCKVRMSITDNGFSVCGPTSMGDAHKTLQTLFFNLIG